MLNINIDLSALKELSGMDQILDQFAKEETLKLGAMCQAHMVELANERLHSRRQKYLDNLKPKVEEDCYILELDASQLWVEEGMEPHNMLDDLLSSPKAKHAKDGSMYLIVPFDKSPGKGQTGTQAGQMDLVNTLKGEMKKQKIPWSKIEKDDQGRPKIGRLHSFSVEDKPLKTQEGPNQGHGPIGAVKQGITGIPFLRNVNVYQHEKDGKVSRSVLTFRIASSKHREQGRWEHPGLTPINIFPDTQQWGIEQVEKILLPDLMARLGNV